ncbi:MAG: DUF2017 family protein [Ilumatobacteraceae bacterium]
MPRRRESRQPRRVVERVDEGLRINLGDDEIGMLVRLLGEVRDLITSDDPATAPLRRRLFPPAYHLEVDAEAEAEYQRFMREDLVASRLEAITAVEECLAAGQGAVMTPGQVDGFVRSLNAVRLVLGTLLDVGEDHDPDEIDIDDPMFAEHQLYMFLSWLLEMTLSA